MRPSARRWGSVLLALLASTVVLEGEVVAVDVARVADVEVLPSPQLIPPLGAPAREVDLLRGGRYEWAELFLRLEAQSREGLDVIVVCGAKPRLLKLDSTRDGVISSGPLFCGRAWISVSGPGVRVLLERIDRGLPRVSNESAIGVKNVIPIDQSEVRQARDAIRGVALIDFEVAAGVRGRCNAMLVDERVLVTNAHCMNASASFHPAVRPRAFFDFESEQARGEEIAVAAVLASWDNEDVSVLELKTAPSDAGARVRRISSFGGDQRGPKFMVQYYRPYGWAPSVSADQDCRIVNEQSIDPSIDVKAALFHGCDTDEGSSGSGLLTGGDGRIVGLNSQGRLPGVWKNNRAVRPAILLGALAAARTKCPSAFGPSGN